MVLALTMNGGLRPTVHCFAAFQHDDGRVWGTVHRVTLDTAEWMQQIGYVIVGPDPHDMIDLTAWEKEQSLRHRT